MIVAPLPTNEARRLAALLDLGILDTEPEAALDGLVACVAQATGAPIALVSLIDQNRQWFKAKVGLEADETGRDVAFCAHAILADEPLVVCDSLSDVRFADNPLVVGDPHVKSYLGVPIKAPGGELIGTLCAIDRQPHQWTQAEVDQVQMLANLVSALLRQRKAMLEVRQLSARVHRLGETLQFEQSMLEKVANLTGIATWYFDIAANTLVWSSKARQLHGVDDSHEPTLTTALDYFEGEARHVLCDAIDATLSDGRWFDLELPFGSGPGDRWVRVSGKPVMVDGQIVRLLGAYQDITAHREHQKALTEALIAADEASKAKMTFLANMSHEIRTPLNGIIGIADAMKRTPLEPRQKEMVDLVALSGSSLQRLLDDLLDMSKIDAGGLSLEQGAVDVASVVRSASELHRAKAEAKGLSLSVHDSLPHGLRYKADAVRIRQIVSNLVSNAIKFTAAGSVRVEIGPGPAGMVSLAVTDTGIGFDEATGRRLFERFEQADGSTTRLYGGTGLGLSICKALCELMGGKISATATPGAGSRFEALLSLEPIAGQCEPHTKTPEAPLGSMGPAGDERQPLRVLLAEDHPVNQRVVSMMLEPLGAEVILAANGLEAVAHFSQARYDLVLMDMAMPEMDGLQATRLIRQWEADHGQPRTPVAMLSANAMQQHLDAARDAGCDGHIAKPVTADQLIRGISEAMNSVASMLSDEVRAA
ncbi:MAG: ATP-binding protein [Hyphomonadaceae bacterium]|nr:ATP-binding protein [Hyphomonadaceae bacterium]